MIPRQVPARLDRAWLGAALQGSQGKFRHGWEGRGAASQRWARQGTAKAGTPRTGKAGLGVALHGQAWRGMDSWAGWAMQGNQWSE